MIYKIIYKITQNSPRLWRVLYNTKYWTKRKIIINFPQYYSKRNFVEFPVGVQVQTTSYCNGMCVSCPYKDTYKKHPQGMMRDKLFKKIVKECSENHAHIFTPFLMGEPLFDPKLFQRIKYARKMMPDAGMSISTNAALLDKKKAKKLAKSPLNSVNFNVQGATKESYKRVMTGLNFEKVIENIKYYLDLDKPYDPLIRFPLFNIPRNEIDIFINMWKDWNVRIELQVMQNRAGNLDFDQVQLKEIYGCAHDRHLKWFSIIFNGDSILCCNDWNREVVLGNIKNNTIEEIWKSEKYENIRKMISGKIKTGDNFICKRCFYGVGP